MKLGEKIDFDLSKEYEFPVTVNGKSGNFFAELKLSPKGITIRISGDESPERHYGFAPFKVDTMECVGFNMNFLLFNLHCVKSGTSAVDGQSYGISHFEALYTAEYVIASRLPIAYLELSSIHLFSPTLKKWVGYTEKQQEIVNDQISGSRVGLHATFENFDPSEFLVGGESAIVSVSYNLTAKASPLDFEVGVRFPPSFDLFLPDQIHPKDVMPTYQKAYAFLSTLHGHELSMDRIELLSRNPRHDEEAYLYYPKRALTEYEITSHSWFPLSHNLRFRTLDCPELPLDSIVRYFSKENSHAEKWIKYTKYRRMENPEERFLGFFRLLESLTKTSKSYLDPELLEKIIPKTKKIMIGIFKDKKAVDSFLNGIHRYNNSKYNTEKCFHDFYKKLPTEIVKEWTLNKKDFGSICTLRNNISHANEFSEDPDSLLKKCSFIEALLLIALLETIDIPITTTTKLISRLPGAHRLYQ